MGSGIYYYYGSGISGFIINVDDPSINYGFQYASSTDGVQMLPLGSSKFIMGVSETNADSYLGMYTAIFDPASGKDYAGNPLTSGGTMSYSSGQYSLDHTYATTQYPCLVPIERWALPGLAQNG
jgi:hypothetical protein